MKILISYALTSDSRPKFYRLGALNRRVIVWDESSHFLCLTCDSHPKIYGLGVLNRGVVVWDQNSHFLCFNAWFSSENL